MPKTNDIPVVGSGFAKTFGPSPSTPITPATHPGHFEHPPTPTPKIKRVPCVRCGLAVCNHHRSFMLCLDCLIEMLLDCGSLKLEGFDVGDKPVSRPQPGDVGDSGQK